MFLTRIGGPWEWEASTQFEKLKIVFQINGRIVIDLKYGLSGYAVCKWIDGERPSPHPPLPAVGEARTAFPQKVKHYYWILQGIQQSSEIST